MYHTYIIYSETTGIYYTGSTSNLEDRIIRHNSSRNKYTKGKGPWKLVKTFEFATRSKAVQLEIKIKNKGAGRFLQEQVLQSGPDSVLRSRGSSKIEEN